MATAVKNSKPVANGQQPLGANGRPVTPGSIVIIDGPILAYVEQAQGDGVIERDLFRPREFPLANATPGGWQASDCTVIFSPGDAPTPEIGDGIRPGLLAVSDDPRGGFIVGVVTEYGRRGGGRVAVRELYSRGVAAPPDNLGGYATDADEWYFLQPTTGRWIPGTDTETPDVTAKREDITFALGIGEGRIPVRLPLQIAAALAALEAGVSAKNCFGLFGLRHRHMNPTTPTPRIAQASGGSSRPPLGRQACWNPYAFKPACAWAQKHYKL